MKKSAKNLGVIENFILHVTHASYDGDAMWDEPQTFTAKDLYRMAKEYIKEDHVDGEDNSEDHIVTYGAESSFQHEDKDKEYPEHIVVVADFGEDGTRTVATFENIENLEAVNDFIKVLKDPYSVL